MVDLPRYMWLDLRLFISRRDLTVAFFGGEGNNLGNLMDFV